jgi:hypothetical protein
MNFFVESELNIFKKNPEMGDENENEHDEFDDEGESEP